MTLPPADTTLLVKTCWRPAQCLRLVLSVRRWWPDMPVVVVDDTAPGGVTDRPGLEAAGARVFEFPDDSGIGACYNWALQYAITTRWTIICDDDDRFDSDDLEPWAELLAEDAAEVIGGQVHNERRALASRFVGRFEWRQAQGGRELWLRHYRPVPLAPAPCDYMPNFFIAATEALRRAPWDEAQKVCRHADWFLLAQRAGLRCVYCPQVTIIHDHGSPPPSPPQYRRLRTGRYPAFLRRFEAKWGLVEGGLHE